MTRPRLSAVTVRPLPGPSPRICRVSKSFSPFSITPIMAPAVSRRPRAAVITGLVLCACLASSTRFLVVAANARICVPAAVARTI